MFKQMNSSYRFIAYVSEAKITKVTEKLLVVTHQYFPSNDSRPIMFITFYKLKYYYELLLRISF